jgi:hypothetical protein
VARQLPPSYEWTLVKRQQIVVPISVGMRTKIRRSPRRTGYPDIRSFTSLLIQDVKRVGSSFDARDHLLPGPLPANLRIPQVRNMFVGTEGMGLGDTCDLYICHVRFLSELALLDFGVNYNLTRAYTAKEVRFRHQQLYANVYSNVKGANWPIFLPTDFVLRVNFVR